jgi:teichuronic acid biosynthesis protein TuaE
MHRVSGSSRVIPQLLLNILLVLSGGAVGALVALASGREWVWPPVLIVGIAVAFLGVPFLTGRRTVSFLELPFHEILRWGFLIMLPAAIVGSVAAWPTFRTLSAFRLLYLGLCIGAPTWLLLKRGFSVRLQIGRFLLFFAFWVVWALVSLTWAVDKLAGTRYFIFLVMMISLTIGTTLAVNTVRTLRIVLLLLLLIFLLGIAIGLLEATTDFRLPTSGLIGRPEVYQWASTSFFHGQNELATYIALWLPFLLAAAFFTRRPWLVSAAGICAVLSVVCLLYTGSRANLLALALTIPSLLLIIASRKGLDIKLWQVATGLLILFGVALAAYLGVRGSLPGLSLPGIGVQHWRVGTLASDIAAGTGSGANRVRLTLNGLAVLRNSGLLGVGPGNAEYHLQRRPGTEMVYNLHNWWMEVLVNGGIFVFVGYLLFYAALLYHLFQVAVGAKGGVLPFAATSLFTALVGYSFGALASSSAIHFTPMWVHFGLGMAVINLHRKCQTHTRG